MCRRTDWCWVEIISTQHLLPISTQHPDENYGSDISFSGTHCDFISHILKWSRNYGRYSPLKPRKTNLRLLTRMPWLATFHAPPWWMVDGIPPSINEGWSCDHSLLCGKICLAWWPPLVWLKYIRVWFMSVCQLFGHENMRSLCNLAGSGLVTYYADSQEEKHTIISTKYANGAIFV